MHFAKFSTIFLIALFALSTQATAQKIYKCGTTYSQQACSDGVTLPVVPAPEAGQKTATDQATQRDALTADRMEKSRLQQEKKDLAANTSNTIRQARTLATAANTKPASLKLKRKTNKKLEEFRAVVPGTGTTKKHSKKKLASFDATHSISRSRGA